MKTDSDIHRALQRTGVVKAYCNGYIIHVSCGEGRDKSKFGLSIRWYDNEPCVSELFLPSLDTVKQKVTATCGDVFASLTWQVVRPE